MRQIALPLDWPTDPAAQKFIISSSNAHAVAHLERWGQWPVLAVVLVGPPRSGRSLLAQLFVAKTGGCVIDDAPCADEARVFHAWNLAQAHRRPLVLVADLPLVAWRVGLPDLRSRLAATPVIALDPPDDALIDYLIEHELARRGIVTRPDVRAYIVQRIERSHMAVLRFVEEVASASFKRRSGVTRALARAVLAEMAPPGKT